MTIQESNNNNKPIKGTIRTKNKRNTISNDTPILFNFYETVVRFLSARCTLHRHVDCGKPLFSVCVPTPDINYHRNVKVVFEVLISDFFTLRSKHEMLRKVPKIKGFYEVFFCINTIVSTVLPDSHKLIHHRYIYYYLFLFYKILFQNILSPYVQKLGLLNSIANIFPKSN